MASGGRSLLKMSDEAFDFVCTACAEDNNTAEAVKYCVECSGYCCQPCTDGHKKVQILKKHNLPDVSQGKQSSSQRSCSLEIPTEQCSIHRGKVVDMYCEDHDVVGCSTCFFKHHKSCQVQKQDPYTIQALQGIGQVQKQDPYNIQALQGIGQVQKHDPYTIQALQGIGQVQKHDPYTIQALQGIGQVQKHIKQKHDIYTIKGSTNITIKHSHDSMTCRPEGCCLTHDNQLLVTDFYNKKLKRFDIQNMSVVDYCTLDYEPLSVCCISKHEVAVAHRDDNKIQFVTIHIKMTPTRLIKMSHRCYGIAFNDGNLYVTDYGASLYVYDMTGTLLKTITRDNAGNQLFDCSSHVTFNESGDRMFVGDGNNGLVCFDRMGNYMSTITDAGLKCVDGVCVDGRGNMFVVGSGSENVVQFSENGKNLGVVVNHRVGLQRPRSVCFHQGLNRMFVTMQDSEVVKMYELE